MTASPAPLPTDPSGFRGLNPGHSLIRSEEQLHVGTERVVAGYARLEKFTVTETKTITVEVTHEEVRLVQRAAADNPPDQQPAGSASDSSGDAGRWMVLSREEVVVTTRVVPVEQVRLEIYPVTEQQQITEEVRKEEIDTAPETTWTSARDSTTRT